MAGGRFSLPAIVDFPPENLEGLPLTEGVISKFQLTIQNFKQKSLT
jgi:hypothetical protein